MKRFVQFPHPGGEAGPDRQEWQRAARATTHVRKFVVAEATFRRALDGPDERGLVTAWVEWEAASECRRLGASAASRLPGMPKWLHRPISPRERPPTERLPLNTDPVVFGERMVTTVCRQPSPSLRGLEPGSVLVFGSGGRHFVGDTVIVVARNIEHDADSYRERLRGRVSDVVFQVTLDPMYVRQTARFAALIGATASDPIDGMFSFVPCLPADGGVAGFARPRFDGLTGINPRNARQLGLNRQITPDRIPALWRRAAEITLAAGLALAVRLDLPPRSALEAGGDPDLASRS